MADVKSNVYFKRGTQANLKSATAVDGCFYLTQTPIDYMWVKVQILFQ